MAVERWAVEHLAGDDPDSLHHVWHGLEECDLESVYSYRGSGDRRDCASYPDISSTDAPDKWSSRGQAHVCPASRPSTSRPNQALHIGCSTHKCPPQSSPPTARSSKCHAEIATRSGPRSHLDASQTHLARELRLPWASPSSWQPREGAGKGTSSPREAAPPSGEMPTFCLRAQLRRAPREGAVATPLRSGLYAGCGDRGNANGERTRSPIARVSRTTCSTKGSL